MDGVPADMSCDRAPVGAGVGQFEPRVVPDVLIVTDKSGTGPHKPSLSYNTLRRVNKQGVKRTNRTPAREIQISTSTIHFYLSMRRLKTGFKTLEKIDKEGLTKVERKRNGTRGVRGV